MALLILALASTTGAAQAPDRGQAFARANCGACHAIGPADASPMREAPPFRDLHRRYPVEQLSESLAEGIVGGHPAMPEFRLTPTQIEDFLAYLRGLAPQPSR